MKKFAAALVLLSIATYASSQDIAVLVNLDDIIVVKGTFETAGMDFASSTGNLVPAADAAPFTFFLANTSESIVFAALPGTRVAIDGELVTSAGYKGPFDSKTGFIDPADLSVAVGFPGAIPVTHELPEPASGLMAAVGALGLLGSRRRR